MDAPDLHGPFLVDVAEECRRAETMYPSLHSFHEAYAVIKEELDEFWEEVRKKDDAFSRRNARKELVQIAAMVLRTARDLRLEG